MDRNPHASIKDEPITKAMLDELRDKLVTIWEDTMLVTNPNHHYVVLVGNLLAIVDTCRQLMDKFDPTMGSLHPLAGTKRPKGWTLKSESDRLDELQKAHDLLAADRIYEVPSA